MAPPRAPESASEEERPLLRLDPETIEALASRVAELLASRLEPARARPPRRLQSAAEVSEWWGVERSWVYEHADELGAIRLGTGCRPRLRFDPDLVAQRLAAVAAERAAPDGRRRGRRRSRRIPVDAADLLPLRGDPELRSSTGKRGPPGGAGTPPAVAPKTLRRDEQASPAWTRLLARPTPAPALSRQGGKSMGRKADGQVIERRWKAGRGYALRFLAYGERHYLTLGLEGEGWTRKRAEEELQSILADVRRGIWIPPDRNGHSNGDDGKGPEPTFHQRHDRAHGQRDLRERVGRPRPRLRREHWRLCKPIVLRGVPPAVRELPHERRHEAEVQPGAAA